MQTPQAGCLVQPACGLLSDARVVPEPFQRAGGLIQGFHGNTVVRVFVVGTSRGTGQWHVPFHSSKIRVGCVER